MTQPPDSAESAGHSSLKYHLLGPSLTKAGQDAVDQTKISEIIYEASKGSKFFSREAAKDELLTQRISSILALKSRLQAAYESHSDDTLSRELRAADTLLAQLELARDLTQTIVHVDCDAFYAAVEQLDHPELEHLPFAVGGGVLTTCNYVARQYGCRSGMAGFVAKKLCPKLVLLPLNFDKYRAKAEDVREVLARYDARFESASIDEAYLNMTAYCASHDISPEDAVQQMRAEVFERAKITVSAGIAANARLAKICSNMNKPNGQCLLPSDRTAIMEFMARLSPRKVNGVGRVLERGLSAIGISSCGELYAQRAFLKPLFGDKAAEFLLACYLGLGRTHIQPAETYERKSVGTERTFADTGDPHTLRERLRQTATDLEQDLHKAECKGRTLCIKVKMHTYEVYTRQVAAPRGALFGADDIYALALPMLAKLEAEFPGMKLRLMGLRCSGLVNSTRRPDTRAFFGLRPKPAHDAESEAAKKIEDVEGAWEGEQNDADQAVEDAIDASQAEAGAGKEEAGAQEDEWWECPICIRPQTADERVFNEHIDLCLSRQTIREAVHEDAETTRAQGRDSATVTAARSGSPALSGPTMAASNRKKRKVAGETTDPRQKKLCFKGLPV